MVRLQSWRKTAAKLWRDSKSDKWLEVAQEEIKSFLDLVRFQPWSKKICIYIYVYMDSGNKMEAKIHQKFVVAERWQWKSIVHEVQNASQWSVSLHSNSSSWWPKIHLSKCLAKQHIPNRHVAVLFQRFLPVVTRFIECWHLGMTNTTKSQLSFRGFRVVLCFVPPAWGGICPPAQLLQVAQQRSLLRDIVFFGPLPCGAVRGQGLRHITKNTMFLISSFCF